MINMLIMSLGTSICTFAFRDGLREVEYKQKAERTSVQQRWIAVSQIHQREG